MHAPARLVVPVVCLGLVIGTPTALAQAIPKSLIRLCLRNVISGLACYVIGRGGELIVDGSLTAAWAKAKESVAGEPPEEDKDGTAPARQPPPPMALNSLTNPRMEPILPSDLDSLSKRLQGSLKRAPNDRLSEGFLIYDAPKSDVPKSVQPKSDLPASGLTAPAYEPLFGARKPGSDAYRALNEDKPSPPGKALTLEPKLAIGQLSKAQLDCQSTRERLYGLSFFEILGAPDFDAKFKRRMVLVVAPCANARDN